MDSIKTLIVLFLTILFLSCSSDDSEFLESEKCKLTKYGYQFTITPTGIDTTYRHELNYIDSKTIVRSNFGLYPVINFWTLLSKDSAIYDEQNRIAKIYHINTLNSSQPRIEKYSKFVYNNSSDLPSRIDEKRYDLSSDISYSVTEDISYNSDNQIDQTLLKNPTFNRSILTNYSYNESKNVSKITKVTTFEFQEGKDSLVITFKDYDDKKNPFFNLPFFDLREGSYSPNNSKFREHVRYIDGEYRGGGYYKNDYKYNQMDYPLIGEYNCQ